MALMLKNKSKRTSGRQPQLAAVTEDSSNKSLEEEVEMPPRKRKRKTKRKSSIITSPTKPQANPNQPQRIQAWCGILSRYEMGWQVAQGNGGCLHHHAPRIPQHWNQGSTDGQGGRYKRRTQIGAREQLDRQGEQTQERPRILKQRAQQQVG